MPSREAPLLGLAAADFLAAILLLYLRPAGVRLVLLAGVVMLAAALTVRGIAIGYVPFTQRPETMATLALAIGIIALLVVRGSRSSVRSGRDEAIFGTIILAPAVARA